MSKAKSVKDKKRGASTSEKHTAPKTYKEEIKHFNERVKDAGLGFKVGEGAGIVVLITGQLETPLYPRDCRDFANDLLKAADVAEGKATQAVLRGVEKVER
jgi:hypothetical protein